MIQFLLIDVKSITSNVPRSNFLEADLEYLAEMILETKGLLRPLVLKMVDPENYVVVDGDLEYYAAVRAKEKDARKGEMVNAFVISPKSEEMVMKQVEALRPAASSSNPTKITVETTSFEARLLNVELRFEKQVSELRLEQVRERQKIEDEMKEIKSRIPKPIKPLEAFNALNSTQLASKFRSAGIVGKTAVSIVEKIQSERAKEEFRSLRDVVIRIKGLGDKRMLDIIDNWL